MISSKNVESKCPFEYFLPCESNKSPINSSYTLPTHDGFTTHHSRAPPSGSPISSLDGTSNNSSYGPFNFYPSTNKAVKYTRYYIHEDVHITIPSNKDDVRYPIIDNLNIPLYVNKIEDKSIPPPQKQPPPISNPNQK